MKNWKNLSIKKLRGEIWKPIPKDWVKIKFR